MAKMAERTKELIAVGAAVTANCLPCLEYHVGKAREAGAAQEEIREAVEVGRTVRKGAAAKLDRLSAALTASAVAATATEGCGCA
jgi:AhpD family alkylhydroperoxidase